MSKEKIYVVMIYDKIVGTLPVCFCCSRLCFCALPPLLPGWVMRGWGVGGWVGGGGGGGGGDCGCRGGKDARGGLEKRM